MRTRAAGSAIERADFAIALARFCRRQADLKLKDVGADGECLQLADQVLQCLHPVKKPVAKPRPGRPRVFDWTWAESCLLNIVLQDPDGLPPVQRQVVDRLRACLEADGRAVPSDPALKKFVSEFYSRIIIREQELRTKFANSSDLQSQFGDEETYVRQALIRQRLAESWSKNKDLQMRFADPHGYIEAMLDQYFVSR